MVSTALPSTAVTISPPIMTCSPFKSKALSLACNPAFSAGLSVTTSSTSAPFWSSARSIACAISGVTVMPATPNQAPLRTVLGSA